MSGKERVVIVGAGIVGLAHALEAGKRGKRVTVIERSNRAYGASIRNFGMVWPMGQPPGVLLRRALRSREVWLEAAREGGFWGVPCGSVHVAHERDEMAVIEEFKEIARRAEFEVELLSADAACKRSPGVRREGLLGGLWSPHELCVDPREAIRAIPGWLTAKYGVAFEFGTTATCAGTGWVETGDGREFTADTVIVCSGEDFGILFPKEYARAKLTKCKLQMLRTMPQPGGWRMGPHLCAGLTLQQYKAFTGCATLPALKARFERENAEHLKWGVHVLVSQNALGELTLGDSHEYGPGHDPFDLQFVDDLIMGYLKTFFEAPTLEIAQRWHGVYAKSTIGETELVANPEPGVWAVNGLGGMGMTLSFGLAQEVWACIDGTKPWTPGWVDSPG